MRQASYLFVGLQLPHRMLLVLERDGLRGEDELVMRVHEVEGAGHIRELVEDFEDLNRLPSTDILFEARLPVADHRHIVIAIILAYSAYFSP